MPEEAARRTWFRIYFALFAFAIRAALFSTCTRRLAREKETNRRNSLSYLCRHGGGFGRCVCAFCVGDLHKSHNQISKLASSFFVRCVHLLKSSHTNPKTISFSAELPEPLQRNETKVLAELILFSSFHMNKFLSGERVFFSRPVC